MAMAKHNETQKADNDFLLFYCVFTHKHLANGIGN